MSFHLRTLLTVVTAACVMVYLLTVASELATTIGLLVYATLVTSFFLAGAVYASDNLKAFCRGALLPMLILFFFLTYISSMQVFIEDLKKFSDMADGATRFLRRWTIGSTLLSTWMGLSTLGFKRLVEPREPREPRE
jgi:hypothetical protein